MWMVFNVKGTADGTKTSLKTAGNHSVATDCSTNNASAPNAMELLATSAQSCLQVMIYLIASEKKMQIGDVSWTFRVGVAGSDTPRSMVLTADLQVDDEKDAAQIGQLMKEVKARCPMYTMCKEVGIDIAFEAAVNGTSSDGNAKQSNSNLTQIELQSAGKAMQSTITTADSHVLVVDEPEALGGSDTGANPMEMLGASVQAALHSRLLEVARERGIVLGEVEWSVDVGIDVEGLMGVQNVVVHPQKISIAARITSDDINQAQLGGIRKAVVSRSGILKQFKSKKIATDVTFTLKK